jgi:uncharacterized repeat protein (TIGR03837 family)
MPHMPVSCDLFCAVVDNLGDAGVCWRLARQLSDEHGWTMRLWIDDTQPLGLLRPGIDPELAQQTVDGVEICRWTAPFPAVTPARVVIEAFACALPAGYVAAMARQAPPPVWINLEYLSAEAWVAGCHGLGSPHPRLPLNKHFFFPGFTAGTGGLIRERSLAVPPAPTFQSPLTISLFCYDNPALPRLLDAWAAGTEPLECRVAEGLPRRQVEAWLGAPFIAGAQAARGSLSLQALPFVAQPEYDAVLAGCDLNFVRGEDSFVRAQWTERPFAWQIYPQTDNVHHGKLDAFLSLYTAGLDAPTSSGVANFWRAWNGTGDVDAAWLAFRAVLPVLATHARTWATQLRDLGDLAGNLAEFCETRI